MKIDLFSDINKDHYYTMRYPQIDRLMVKILWWHFVIVSLAALAIYYFMPALYYPSPLSWRVISLEETLWVIALGFIASLVPTIFRNKIANHYHYRILVAMCLFVYSYSIVFVSGGSIEGHFHFFVIFALLAIYYDWRLGWLGLVVVALHHGILNFVEPYWVYYYGRNDVSVLAHALPVAIAVLYLTWICENGRRSVEALTKSNKTLEMELREKIPGLQ